MNKPHRLERLTHNNHRIPTFPAARLQRTTDRHELSAAAQHQNPRTRPLAAAERDARILALRSVGVQIQPIAAQVGASEKTVRRVIQRRLAQLNQQIQQNAAGIRAAHLMELQGLRDRLRPALAAPDHGHRIGAAKAWINVLEREARLLGLDAPARIELAAQAQASEALLQALADRLAPDCMEQVIAALTDAPIDCA